MTDVPNPADVTTTDDPKAARDEVVAAVRDHAGRIARELALLQGGDYGRETFRTDDAEWTVKYEGGDLEFLLYDGNRGGEVYVVSTKQPPEPNELADAMADYDAFVAAYNEYVESLDGVLDGVDTEFPPVTSTDGVVGERDRILARVREAADAIASELYRFDGTDYGTFKTTVDGTRWELKWEEGRVSYLRAGGQGGIYLLSQYDAPSARDVRKLAPEFGAFVAAFNDHVEDLEADLSTISVTVD